ncbi:MAG: VCBS repeat-containing protein [Elusimicrobia bacterium]|nr:VCBS repeat-containing protein [Elusimicrobiota bacterium]
MLWSQDDASNWSTISNTTSAVTSSWFDPSQIEVDGAGGGLYLGGVAWGDYDNDGDLDVLASGYTGSTRALRIYKNNGNGTLDATEITLDGLGLRNGDVAWGDYDNDGDLDFLASGETLNFGRNLRIYRNNGDETFSGSYVEDAFDGLDYSSVAWGDFNNDGDLDVLFSGATNTTYELRVYKNNGNATLDAAQIEVDDAGGGLSHGGVAWGDYDKDGDLDILASGYTGSTRELWIHKNNGNGTFNPTQIEVDGAGGGLSSGSVVWGDYDNDGDLDVLSSGQQTSGLTRELRVYKNNGNGTLDATQIEVDGAGGGLSSGSVVWGDYDNDGDLDVLANGYTTLGTNELRVYKNNGTGTIDATQIEVDGAGGGLQQGDVAWGDFDNDGDLDVLASGQQTSGSTKELRVYKNRSDLTQTNTAPTAPGTLSGAFSFNLTAVSVASFTWVAGTDSGTGATPENVLTYDVQLSTVSNFSKVLFSGQLGASPRMGSYLKPPKIFNGNTHYGVVLKSMDPWNAQTTASYGLRTDTTYYHRVKTVDSALAESGWSGGGALLTSMAPSTHALTASTGQARPR